MAFLIVSSFNVYARRTLKILNISHVPRESKMCTTNLLCTIVTSFVDSMYGLNIVCNFTDSFDWRFINSRMHCSMVFEMDLLLNGCIMANPGILDCYKWYICWSTSLHMNECRNKFISNQSMSPRSLCSVLNSQKQVG